MGMGAYKHCRYHILTATVSILFIVMSEDLKRETMHLTVKFIDKEYYIPQDVLTYIDLLNFTDSVQKQLVGTFIRKLKNEIAKGKK